MLIEDWAPGVQRAPASFSARDDGVQRVRRRLPYLPSRCWNSSHRSTVSSKGSLGDQQSAARPPCRRPRRDHRVRRPPVRAPGPRRPAIAEVLLATRVRHLEAVQHPVHPRAGQARGRRRAAHDPGPADAGGARQSCTPTAFTPASFAPASPRTKTESGKSSLRWVRPSFGPRSAAPARWCGSPYPTTPPPSPGSTSKTSRWSPPATRPRTTTSHGACGNKAPSSSACLPTRAPNTPAETPFCHLSGIRRRPSRVPRLRGLRGGCRRPRGTSASRPCGWGVRPS